MHQPFGREVWRGTDGERARALALQKALRPNGYPIERIANDGEVVTPSLRDHQALPLAEEKLQAELRFEFLDLMTHGALRHRQLVRGPRKALVPGGGFEHLECIEGRQSARHLARDHEEN